MKKNRILSAILVLALLFGSVSTFIPVRSFAERDANSVLIEENNDIPLRLYYDEEASHGVAAGYDDVDKSFGSGSSQIEANLNDDWERWSIPLGNGYFGANVFGRTGTERIQLTEKTLANPYRIKSDSENTDGLNNFSETYIQFDHEGSIFNPVSDYSRELDLKTAVSTVSYKYKGVTYTREYFTSYPDKAMVIKLDASASGALSFILRPTVPYEQEYMNSAGDRGGKTGTVTSSVSNGVGEVVLSGKLEYFDIDFYGLYKVYTNGGTVSATTCTNEYNETDGTITVSGATSAYIVITMGTDYELVSEQFTASDTSKPTFSTGIAEAEAKVRGYMNAIEAQTGGKSFEDAYALLKANHIADYSELFGRVTLDLGCKESDYSLTTDVLLQNYKNGSGSAYLETLYFQYGRYLLIASSRKGALPANLQGAWNRYNHAPWSSGYWHNINVQMNYWPAFSTNIAETFEAYVDYNTAYMQDAKNGATSTINKWNPSMKDQDGGNGWSIETGGYVSDINASTSIGNLGFTTQMFWEYYEYTKDETILREVVYPVLVGAARFITKMVREDADGNFIAFYSDSPEQYKDPGQNTGSWYHTDKGTAYAQSFAYQNNYNMLLAAKELGIEFTDTTHEDYAIIQRVLAQIDKYDPIRIGLSGQVKEFFEEEYYGDLGEYTHRHISQLVGLYPGNVINGTTPAWLDAAEYVLTERGDKATGWGVAHRLNLWARVQNGERAYDLLEQLLKVNTATNLWDLHPPFQIDGNLGGTSGVAEMLLQSHAGYIEPLAAIPAAWANGSYTGLVARGNFEVSAAWANGTATTFNILSKDGGSVSVKYSGIEKANLYTSDGKAVSYQVTGDDIITFNTEAGKTYIISNFEAKESIDAPTGLAIDTAILSTSTLTWNESSDAFYYNVYVAKDSDPDYTLLTSTNSTTYVYTPGKQENSRLTFAVTAVSATGTESDRALVYRNPDDLSSSVDGISASVIEDELQVAIKSNEYASKYKLYTRKNATSKWTLVQESFYPIIIEEAYDSLMKYGVSVVNYFGEESEIVQISKYNNAPVSIDYNASNILLDVPFEPTAEANAIIHAAAYGYQTLTDGSMHSTSGRFSTKTTNSALFNATAFLPTAFLLGELRIFDFDAGDTYANNVGSSLKIELLYDGAWTTVYECSDTAEIITHRTKSASGTRYLSFDFSGHKAYAIRISAPSPVSGKSISIYEIECSGIALQGEKTYNENILLGMDMSLTEASTKHLNSASGKADVLTDGTLKVADSGPTIFYTWYGQTDMQFDGTVHFKNAALLKTLRIYDYRGTASSAASAGPQIIIQVKSDGVWTTVHDVTIDSTTISKYRKSGARPNSAENTTEYWLEFDLELVEADEIRIYLPPKSTQGQNYGFYEIECEGYYLDDGGKYYNNVFEEFEFVAATTASGLWKGTYANLTDGDYSDSGRLVTHGKPSHVDGTLDFGNFIASLETLTINFGTYGQARSGSALIIQVLENGVWKDALNIVHDRAYQGEVTFELNGAKGNAVRLYIPSVYPEAYGTLLAGDNIAIHEISCSGTLTPCQRNDVVVQDVFDGFNFEPANATIAGNIWGENTYNKITDDGATNDSNSRFATSGGKAADGVLDFGGKVFALGTLTVNYDPYTATRCGQDFGIYVYYNGEWTQVLNHVHSKPVNVEAFDLGGVLAEKVRFTVSGKYAGGANADGNTGDTIIIYEMSCSGAEILPKGEERKETDNIFTDLQFVPGEGAGSVWEDNTYDKMTDGVSNNDANRMVTLGGAPVDAILDFEGRIAELGVFTLNYGGNAKRCGADLVIYAYSEGVWTAIHSVTHSEAVTTYSVDLNRIRAEKIRFTISAKHSTGDTIAVYEVSCTGALIKPAPSIEDVSSNILLGTTADRLTLQNATAHSGAAVKDLTNAFDGDTTSTRYAVLDTAGAYSLTIDIGEVMPLYTLRIYDWRGGETVTRSDKTKIELYVDGCWIPVITDQPLTTVQAFTSFDLMGIEASKIRITFHNTASNSRATIYEITCTTGSVSAVDRSELLEAYKAFDTTDISGAAFGVEAAKEKKLKELSLLLQNTDASQEEINSYVSSVNDAKKVYTETPEQTLTNDAYGDFTSYNLTLGSEIGFNFYASFNGKGSESFETSFPDAIVYVEYVIFENREAKTVTEQIKLSSLEKDGDRHVLTLNMAAAQMTDKVRLRVVFDGDNFGKLIEQSVRDYADAIIANEGGKYTEDDINLVKAMLNYGGLAQKYFNYKTDDLANGNIDVSGLSGNTAAGVMSTSKTGDYSFDDLRPTSWTLALEENVDIRVYFASENIDAYNFIVTAPDGSYVGMVQPEYINEGLYRVSIEVPDIKYLDEVSTLVIREKSTGNEITMRISAIKYVENKLAASSSATEDLKNLCNALKLYCALANDYNS